MELRYKILFSIVTLLLLVFAVYAAEQKVFVNTNQMGKTIYNVSNMNMTNSTYRYSNNSLGWRTSVNSTGSLITEYIA